MKEKFRFDGLVTFLNIYRNELKSKKLVALFDNYEDAKNQIVYGICEGNENFTIEDLNRLIQEVEQITDIQEYFNEL